MSKPLPFFAGQNRQEKLGKQAVLSPLPIKTNFSNSSHCSVLMRKNAVYLDLGGGSGAILQGQYLYVMFVTMVLVFIPLYISIGGWQGIVEPLLQTKYDEEIMEYVPNYSEFALHLFYTTVPLIFTIPIIYAILRDTIKDIKRTVPFRFNRQRREVAMFKWNKKRKKVVVRYFPWEKVCAMVGEGATVTTVGMIGSGTLFIGGNDENIEGLFWAGMTFGVANNLDGAVQWELIRSYMDYEIDDDAIVDLSNQTFKEVLDQHCKDFDIPTDNIPFETRLWAEINGTRFGIWLSNYYARIAREHYHPDAEFEAWSQPIPESEWVKPSEELNYYNEMLTKNEYASGHNILSIGDIRAKYPKYGEAVENELMS